MMYADSSCEMYDYQDEMTTYQDEMTTYQEQAYPRYSRKSRIIRRFEHSGFQAGLFTFNAVLILLMGIYMLILNNTASNNYFNVARTPLGYWMSDSDTWMLCGFSLLSGVMLLIHASSIRKHKLVITRDGIYGRTAGKFGIHPVSFHMTWDQIQRVKKKHSSQLKVWGPDGRYTLCLSDRREAADIIERMLQKHYYAKYAQGDDYE